MNRNRKCLCDLHQLKGFNHRIKSLVIGDTTSCWFSSLLTSYLLINHIPSDVWGGDGWSDRYVCSSVPVSLLPEGQMTLLEMRTRTAHVSHTVPHELIILLPERSQLYSPVSATAAKIFLNNKRKFLLTISNTDRSWWRDCFDELT